MQPGNDNLALIDKIETLAGVVNDAILSDREIHCAKELLIDEELMISELDPHTNALDAERERRQERVAKIRVARAPHKRIPLEILSQVFFYCLPAGFDHSTNTLPPRPSLAPWLLGQICSLWRNVSRNKRDLWGRPNFSAMDVYRCLTPFCEILPAIVGLALDLPSGNVETVRTVVPHLWRITELILRLQIEAYDELWKNVSPHSFATLQSAEFHIEGSDQVGEHQPSRWEGAEPFQLASKLSKLTLSSPDEFSPALLSLDIPWGQLRSLDIKGLKKLSLVAIFQVMRNCNSLENLSVHFQNPDAVFIPDGHQDMPVLQSLLVHNHVPSTLIDSTQLWNHLSSLNLGDVLFDNGHAILKQSTRLTHLTTSVPIKGTAYTVVGDVPLPHLTSLQLSPISNMWIFRSLVTPVLDVATFFFVTQPDLAPVREMLVSSGCNLLGLVLVYVGEGARQRGIHPIGLHDLLTHIPSVAMFISGGMFFEDNIFEDMGTGVLLPELRTFQCIPVSQEFEALIDMLKRRLRQESLKAVADARLEELKSMYRLEWESLAGGLLASIFMAIPD